MLLVHDLLQTLTTRHHLAPQAATASSLDGAQAEDAYLRTSNLFTPLVSTQSATLSSSWMGAHLDCQAMS